MRHGQRVLTPAGEGVITSGGFSPTMDRSIALARVPVAAEGPCQVEIRSALRAARIVRPPVCSPRPRTCRIGNASGRPELPNNQDA